MARLLVMRRDYGPLKYQPGDIVQAFDDDHVFGTHEDILQWLAAGYPEAEFPAHFYIVDVPGMSVEEAAPYLETAVIGYEEMPDGDPAPITARRREWTLEVPTTARSERTYKAALTPEEFTARIVKK